MIWLLLAVAVGLFIWSFTRPEKIKIEYQDRVFQDDAALMEVGRLREQVKLLEKSKDVWEQHAVNAKGMYEAELKRNETVISQKKSSETRLGQVTEHIIPFLENCRHDPKNMHFMGQPIDYLVFDFDQGEITFLEVKTGNATESKRQKMIKNIIKSGKIYYESMRVNTKGVIVKKQENEV